MSFSAKPDLDRRKGIPQPPAADVEAPSPDSFRRWLHPAALERLLVGVDVLIVVVCGLASSMAYYWHSTGVTGPIGVNAAASMLVAINFVLLLAVRNGYRLSSVIDASRQIRLSLTIWTSVFATLLVLAFSMKISENFSRGATISFYFTGLFGLIAWKAVASRWASRLLKNGQFANSRIVVIAEQGHAASSQSLHELRRHGYRPSKIFEIASSELSSPLLMSSISYRIDELIEFAREHEIERIFLMLNWTRQHVIDSILDSLKILPIPVYLVPDANVASFLRYPLLKEGATWTVELRRAPLTKSERVVKRLFDLVGASAALLLFGPLMLAVALLIKFDSPGSALFRQTRNGFNGKAFKIFKFRTMIVAEDGLHIVQATKDDKRVTRLGRWLRKTSIDELPQLLNVIRGEMSLVGPRPHASAHNTAYERIIGNYAFRHHVKPGITGWAQVRGYRGETKAIDLMEKRIEFDLWYINNWSLWLDCLIVVRTAIGSFWQSRAY